MRDNVHAWGGSGKAALSLGAAVAVIGVGCSSWVGDGLAASPCSSVTKLLDQGDVDAATELLASYGITDVTIPRQVATEFTVASVNCGTFWPTEDRALITSVFFTLFDGDGEYVGAWAYVTEDPAAASDTDLVDRLERLNDVPNDVVDVSSRERVAFHQGDAEEYARRGRANDDSEMSVLTALVEDQG